MINSTRVGRWITEDGHVVTADPSNLYRYVGNHPTNATDPTGLAERELSAAQESAPQGGLYGAFFWPVNFNLSKPTVSGGMILQHITINTKNIVSIDPPGTKLSPGVLAALNPPAQDWWEAWPVAANGSGPIKSKEKFREELIKVYAEDNITINLNTNADDYFFMYACGRDSRGQITKNQKPKTGLTQKGGSTLKRGRGITMV